MARQGKRHRNDLGSLFAASIVIVGGAAICSILFVVGDPDRAPWFISVIAAVAVSFLAVIVGLRFPRIGTGLGFWNAFFATRSDSGKELNYEPRRVNTTQHQPPGTLKPVTAEEARQIHMLSTNTWVPSQLRRRESGEGDSLESRSTSKRSRRP